MNGLPRVAEFWLALLGLILFAPIMLISAVLIKLTSEGSIIFRQRRVGLNGVEFTIFKFRTMRTDATGALITAANDRRVTAVGKILRKTKIDELPELVNVLLGDMAIVGPRPEVPAMVDRNSELWQKVLTVKPGITDPATIRLRNEEALLAAHADHPNFYKEVLQPYKLNVCLDYIGKRSCAGDLRIILATFVAIALPATAPPPLFEIKKQQAFQKPESVRKM